MKYSTEFWYFEICLTGAVDIKVGNSIPDVRTRHFSSWPHADDNDDDYDDDDEDDDDDDDDDDDIKLGLGQAVPDARSGHYCKLAANQSL